MSQIRILPEILSNKIAAGEVVERPASVVKELLENSLDAESTQIVVEIEKGGHSLIRVSDNGMGMPPDDALLSIERYATSKIYKNEDLFSIRTLGFRGEALPSIASVSRFSLVTRHREKDTGLELLMAGGKIQKVIETGAPVGTQVTVKQLFFNTPARRKFLKGIQTEMGHIVDVINTMALGRPGVQFKLVHNNKLLKNWVAVSNPADRVIHVLGAELKEGLIPVQHDDGYLQLEGWLSSPTVTRKTSRSMHIYINGRAARDRVVQHALFEGYAGRLVKGQFPMAVLFIRVPFDRVDVNVHPAKNEVRFSDQKQVHDTVRSAVAHALQQADSQRWGRQFPQEKMLFIKEKPGDYQGTGAWTVSPQQEAKEKEMPAGGSGFSKQVTAQSQLWDRTRFSDLKIIGQYQDIYIVCESNEDLILLDQHAAHERILYEKLKQSRKVKIESQGLLIPETIDLNYREANVLDKFLPELATLGFEIEPFGGDTFAIKSVPAVLGEREIKSLVVEMVEKWVEDGTTDVAEKAIDDTIKLIACHGSIRANQRLTDMEIKTMLEQLDACENPSNCPHGRPTWVKLSKQFFEKAFKRIVN
ncbi:MAG: DNA mismatch repair endonuclease MutL [Deltaproteobacteria bacterium]|nr:DNA mismatch repair endonuclease MutL [Deltaproteobacteria bacterium]